MIYLDNAATTRQKPQPVIDAVVSAMTTLGNSAHPRGEPVRLPDDLRHERKAGNILQLSPA